MRKEKDLVFRMVKLKKMINLFLVLCILCTPIQVISAKETMMSEEQVIQIARKIGKEYNICPELITAIAFKESRYNSNVEYEGCIGIMQVSPKWHRDRMIRLGVSDLYNPYNNMLVATDYLLELFEKYEDLAMVLQVYNGDSNADFYWNGEIDLSEYTKDIIKMSEELERKYEK